MITKIESRGYYIEECPMAGETKAEECVPAQHNTIQLSHNRWFIIYETRGFRGTDDNRSVHYQVRADAPFGPILSGGCLDKAVQDWDPLGDGSRYVKLCNHSVVFGVPEGAIINGQPAVHAGVFAAAWRTNPRILNRENDYLQTEEEEPLSPDTYRCYWFQFRLNDRHDDIEILSPIQPLREKGYEKGRDVCRHPGLTGMNEGYVVPVPYNREITEWAYMLHWAGGICTPIRFRWNPDIELYEWIETGPILNGPDGLGIFESAIAPYGDEWLIAARMTTRTHLPSMMTHTYGNVWFRTDNLFSDPPEGILSREIRSHCPRTFYRFPDRVVRIFTTDQVNTPYPEIQGRRIPLNVMDIDPDKNFAVTKTDVVFDSFKEGLPISLENGPSNHFCRLLPHTGGRTGYVTYFVRPRAIKNRAYINGKFKGEVKPEEIQCSGVYYSKLTYDKDYPPMWMF